MLKTFFNNQIKIGLFGTFLLLLFFGRSQGSSLNLRLCGSLSLAAEAAGGFFARYFRSGGQGAGALFEQIAHLLGELLCGVLGATDVGHRAGHVGFCRRVT
jgi:hypothetical protein